MMQSANERHRMLADVLRAAEQRAEEIEPLVAAWPELTLDDAYLIQQELVAGYGSPVAGLKAALTSEAKQRAMGVDQPGYGVLLERMRVGSGIRVEHLIHPRVEPEIAISLQDVTLNGALTPSDVASRCTGISVALEVIDSRYRNFRFTAVDVYADNCSSARFAVSPVVHPASIRGLLDIAVVLKKNGAVVHTGTPAAVLGSPFNSAAFVLNQAFRHGTTLPDAFILLTGGITEAVPVAAGDTVTAVFEGLETISLAVK